LIPGCVRVGFNINALNSKISDSPSFINSSNGRSFSLCNGISFCNGGGSKDIMGSPWKAHSNAFIYQRERRSVIE
jgi:hypothetical protein